MKRICVITGTRADYGLLKPVIRRIAEESELELRLVVTGMHLSPEFGLTYREIEKDGFSISDKVEMLLSSDTPQSIAKSIGLGIIGFADVLSKDKIDLIVALGDRYETLAAVMAAFVHKIPIAHLHGGELTEGMLDDAMRHSITKMSTLHFVSTEVYKKRVIQLGEQPEFVYNVGAVGVENIRVETLLLKAALEEQLEFNLQNRYALITYHPVTLEENTSEEQFENLLEAIEAFPKLRIIFTKANADAEGRIINSLIDTYVGKNKNKSISFTSMGQVRYLSALKYAAIVIGNSSSGIIEAPSFRIPTIDIGDRQKGRVRADSVIHCENNKKDIIESMNLAFSRDFQEKLKSVENPYEGKNTSKKIVDGIKNYLKEPVKMKKKFYDLSEVI